MKEHLTKILNIDTAAIELIAMIEFLFVTEKDLRELLSDCEGMTGQQINKYVYNRRRQTIVDFKYRDSKEFCSEYNKDYKIAMERLFQEPLTDAKLTKLGSSDPMKIWEIHSRQKPDIRYMKFLLFV